CYAIVYAAIFSLVGINGVPRSIGLMQPMVLFLVIGGSRWLVRNWLGSHLSGSIEEKAKDGVVIYGAGDAGRQLAASLVHSNEFKFLTFVDDNSGFWGGTIDGRSVSAPSEMARLIESQQAKEVWLAMPKVSNAKRRDLIASLRPLPIHVRTLPSFSDLASGRVRLSDVRELDVNELLGRDAVKPNGVLLQKCIFDKTVLVTGAGGSIGSELCRQILAHNPRRILLIDNSEVALYNIHSELQALLRKQSDTDTDTDVDVDAMLVPLLANVQDTVTLSRIFAAWHPQTVYHAAAYKHVPMVEHNPVAGITNNVIGTLNCAQSAIAHGVENFVLVSTDKAVRPTNVMGASKRLAEMALQALASEPKNQGTCLAMVRFGNVLGSSGSVVPLFRKQIEAGGPVTLTHADVTRYFMTIPEAAQLVVQAGAMAKGGEVFVLDMGEPVRIADLARSMIEAAGLAVKDAVTPWGDIEIAVTGLRPGEKLYEELLIGDGAHPTSHPRISQAQEAFMPADAFEVLMAKLENALQSNDASAIRDYLAEAVSGYAPTGEIVDWVEMQQRSNTPDALRVA
ncbi:polysaccharide biosynthesis protein, partial [Burkholderiaceae bacterium]|nr:polysaccharide biosynthesis protein [Burkholderiaceae bacterium]